MAVNCLDCGCPCSLIDIECIYSWSNLPRLSQIENNAPVLNAAHERIRSLLGTTCYNEFCAARTDFIVNNTPLPTKWQALFDNLDFKILFAKWVEFEWYSSPQGAGLRITPNGLHKPEDERITINDVNNIKNNLTLQINIYENRISLIISADPYRCKQIGNTCGCAANSDISGCGCASLTNKTKRRAIIAL